jgi:L-amino acid N-acyltransferase YncA
VIQKMVEADLPAVLDIYKKGIETRNATFETTAPSAVKWDRSHHKFCRFVCIDSGVVAGWAALCPVSQRSCYSGVAEISIYVSPINSAGESAPNLWPI